MIAASIWSLIIPSIERAEEAGMISWLPATIGIIFGTIFIPICDRFINYEKINLKGSKENFMLALAISGFLAFLKSTLFVVRIHTK